MQVGDRVDALVYPTREVVGVITELKSNMVQILTDKGETCCTLQAVTKVVPQDKEKGTSPCEYPGRTRHADVEHVAK